MALLPKAGAVTLLDYAKSIDPDGKVAAVAELLTQSNEILIDMQWIEGNQTNGNKSSIRTGLPSVIWRQLYQGVPPSKSGRATVEDSCGMLETRSEVDVDLAKMYDDIESFRLSEATAFLEAMNQAMAQTLFYGDVTINPERFTGLAPRYSSLSAGNAANIVDAGGTGSDNTSIWLIVWSPNTVSGFFPKNSEAGLHHEDLGIGDAFDANNARFRAYMDHWQWKAGLMLKDWRYVVRIANIDVSDVVGQTGTQASTSATAIMKVMIRAMARIPQMNMGRAVFYGSRTAKEMLSVAALDKSNAALSVQDAVNQFGAIAPGSVSAGGIKFFGVPFRTVDAILGTEARVV